MAQLEVMVERLNRRRSPVTNFADKSNIVDVVPNGFHFESVGYIENILGGWHQHKDGLWSWEKGASRAHRAAPLPFLSLKAIDVEAQKYIDNRFDGTNLKDTIDYNFLLNIESNIKETLGNGISIAILDSPISKNTSFGAEVLRPLNVDHPADAHGSFIAGIIAGISGVKGIANSTKLIELPIRDEFGFQPDNLILQALELLRMNNDLMVVNVSQKLPDKFSTQFADLKNKIIVASAGMNASLQNSNLIFPANLDNVISVGCLSKELSRTIANTSLSKKLDFIIPDINYVSNLNGKSDFKLDNGDSYSCAVLSATISLLISSGRIKKDMNLPEIKNEIKIVAKPYTSPSNFDFLNIINPFA